MDKNLGILVSLKHLIFCVFYLSTFSLYAQEAPSWVDFCENRATGDMQNSILLDYSYAGYHFSEKPIPNTATWNTISVIDHGATPNDDLFDDIGIQAAIDAAEASGEPTVVYFPAGRYKVSNEVTHDTPIEINKSFIVLKGAGTGSGGTEIYAEKMGDTTKKWNTTWNFQFKPNSTSGSFLTDIDKRINRGDTEIEVSSTSKLEVGMVVVINQHEGIENIELNMPGLTMKPAWTKIHETGMRIVEKNVITAINGNKVTLKRPINAKVTADLSKAYLAIFSFVEEVGIEDILFTSGWKEYPQEFVHHANDIVDYGWRALRFENVLNGWVRNVEFQDWNEALNIHGSLAVTVEDVTFSGKQGHVSSQATMSTGVLFQNCEDLVPNRQQGRGGQWHGPGMQLRSTGCVYLNFKMQHQQFVDFHGYQPYGNLLDNIKGGIVDRNGGDEISQPHSGPDLTFWNFEQNSDYTTKAYDFWNLSKNSQAYFAHPKFIGFTSPGETTTFKNVGLNELQGTQVYPKSLFDAQLQLRLYKVFASASSEMDGHIAKNVVNENNNDYWSPESNSVEHYLMLDFGKEKYINGIVLKESNKAISKFKIDCWINGAWESFVPTIANEGQNSWNIGRSVNARKIKLIVEEVVSGKQIQVTEFSVVESNDIPSNNFEIFTTSESCKGRKNGKIEIKALQQKDYVVIFNGNNYSFTKDIIIEGIGPGTYDLCINILGNVFKQCYKVNLEEGSNLAGKIEITNKIAYISLVEGTAPFTVSKNGTELFKTLETDFSVAINQGDNLEVYSNKSCEGNISKRINLKEEIIAYPNPSNGFFEVAVPNHLKKIEIEVYNIYSQLIFSKNYPVTFGKINVNIDNYPMGIYLLKANLEQPVLVKVIKK